MKTKDSTKNEYASEEDWAAAWETVQQGDILKLSTVEEMLENIQ